MTKNKTIVPYGLFESPLTADAVTGASLRFDAPHVSRDGRVYYLESRPSGKTMLVEVVDGKFRDVLPEKFSVQSRVHEYGGAAYTLTPDGNIVFTDFTSMAVYSADPDTGKTEKVLDVAHCRYADFDAHPTKPWLLAVEEDHTIDVPADVVNRIVLIDLEKKSRTTLVEGSDFYMNPRLSPDGTRMAWTQFDHPNMPWIGTELYVAKLTSAGRREQTMHIAGEAGKVSVTEPRWAVDGRLFFSTDATGYYQLSYLDVETFEVTVQKLAAGLEKASIGNTEWQFGNHSYVFLFDKTAVAAALIEGVSKLIKIDLRSGDWEDLNLPLTSVGFNNLAAASETSFIVIGATDTEPGALYSVDLRKESTADKLKSTLDIALLKDNISIATSITCPTAHNLITHGFFYPPKNALFKGPADVKPPVIVLAHGGPTGVSARSFNTQTQYWTTRGYAYVLLNYRGSTSFGRSYISQLNGTWGIADVEDAEAIVTYLGSQALVDPTRAGITGGSAGGYTTLQAVCASSKWRAGLSLFGISDLRALLGETHKFESHYLRGLVFEPGMTEEERQARMVERSSISHPERVSGSLMLLQGSEDKVVPPNQASEFVEKARAAGKDVQMVLFEGEGHGFKRADSNKRTLEEAEKLWRRCLVDVK